MSAKLSSRWPFHRKGTREKIHRVERQLTILEDNKDFSDESGTQELSVDSHIPTVRTTQYMTASAKAVLSVLHSVAGVIPVPLLQESVGLALKIIDICEGVSDVNDQAKVLRDRVGYLMLVIVDNLTVNSEGDKGLVMEAAKEIEGEVMELASTLRTINKSMAALQKKNHFQRVLFKDANLKTVKDCIDLLSTALERFKLAKDLWEYDGIRELLHRLLKLDERFSVGIDNIAGKVDNLGETISGKLDNIAEDFTGHLRGFYKQSLGKSTDKPIVREEIPLKPEVFYGRDDMVNDIAQLFSKEDTSRVCILGPGGMGKTSVSLAVAESPLVRERFTRNPVWVPCIGVTTKALLLEIMHVQLAIAGDHQVTLEKIISELGTSTEPRLIIFDNFETPMLVGSRGTQKGVEDILRKLAALRHVAILVTMRGSRPPCNIALQWQCKHIQPTDEEASLRIFRAIHPSSQNDPYVAELTRVLGHLPFAVTLMANLSRDSYSTAKELLALWAEVGPNILSGDQEQSINQSIRLSLDSNLVKQNPDSIHLLSILSLLPAGTTKDNLLRWWAPKLKSDVPSAIATLMKAGLLVGNKHHDSETTILFVIPVVQSFMRHQRVEDEFRRKVLQSCCAFVLDHACRWLNSSFMVNSKVLAGEDSNIQSILLDSTVTHTQLSDQYFDALIAFCWHRCDTKPTLGIIDYALKQVRTYGKERYVASALWCLGKTYYNLSSFELSYKYLQEAYQLFETLPPGDLHVQLLGAQCGIDLVDVEETVWVDPDEIIVLALKVESKCAALSGDIHGRSLVTVGLVFHYAQRQQEALVYLERAKAVLKAAAGGIPSLAEACQSIARVYRAQDQFPEAINAMEEAWDLAEWSGSLKLQAEIAVEFGEILISANRTTEALNYLHAGLIKATTIESRFETAIALRNMGYAHLCRKDYENAYGAFEVAVEMLVHDGSGW